MNLITCVTAIILAAGQAVIVSVPEKTVKIEMTSGDTIAGVVVDDKHRDKEILVIKRDEPWNLQRPNEQISLGDVKGGRESRESSADREERYARNGYALVTGRNGELLAVPKRMRDLSAKALEMAAAATAQAAPTPLDTQEQTPVVAQEEPPPQEPPQQGNTLRWLVAGGILLLGVVLAGVTMRVMAFPARAQEL